MAKQGKQHKTCTFCGAKDLAWGRTDEGFKLFEGQMVGGSWGPNTARPHNCTKAPKDAPKDGSKPSGAVDHLKCECGVVISMSHEDVLKVGYPACGSCANFFLPLDGEMPKAQDLTPETVEV